MKRIALLTAAISAIVMSCSMDDTESSSSSTTTLNAIGFLSNTSRADIITLSDLKDDKTGFILYAIKNNASTWDTEMDGYNNYTYASGDWGWTKTTPSWPTATTDYPINFYALYAEAYDDITISDSNESSLALTYEASPEGQVDILKALATTSSRPVGDKLPLAFEHILSKVNFQISAAEGVVIHTQAVGFNNICSKRDYSLYSDNWNSQNMAYINDYSYLDTSTPAISSSTAGITGTRGDMMILPQTTTSWSSDSGTSDGSHIYLVYRAETTTNKNSIGYADAVNHPNYSSETDSKYSGTPLFVLVGYPLGDTDFVVEKGKSYTYNISLGDSSDSNGYLLDDYYYDQSGNQTSFEIIGKDVGDPLSDGYIHFTVTVNGWEE